MSRSSEKKQSLKNIVRIQISMIVGYALIVALAIALVTKLAVDKTDEVLKNKIISLTSSLSVQMKLNMDSYMSRMETIATLAFGEENAYTYDAADPDNDEFEAINTEKLITEKMYSLCIMENFVDYGIVYRNNRTVGKISNGTSTLFGEKMFDELGKMITDEQAQDGWFTGYNDDFRRIYYVKRVHENAVLFISFYANELNEVFDNPETLSDMEIRLINEDHNILYSKTGGEVGKALPEEIKQRILGQSSVSSIDSDYLVSVNKCGDWYVVCSIPTKIILNEKNEMTRYIYMTGLIAALIAALVGWYLSYLLIKPVKSIVSDLDEMAHTDQLTGILNKLSFEQLASNCIESSLETENRALIILDIDDFKKVNDTLGHAAGDRLLESTGAVLREVFTDDDYLGRIGGDEFCVLVNSSADEGSYHDYAAKKCSELCEAFSKIGLDGHKDFRVSCSIGAAISPENGGSFKALYAACDKALYRSKKSGKASYTLYSPDMEGEGEQ